MILPRDPDTYTNSQTEHHQTLHWMEINTVMYITLFTEGVIFNQNPKIYMR